MIWIAKLWAHLVSEHAVILDPATPPKDLIDLHIQEHRGPCSIRNHDEKDQSYSLRKIGEVLQESDR